MNDPLLNQKLLKTTLRRLTESDYMSVRDVYIDSIESIAPVLYSSKQIKSWTSMAWLPQIFERTLSFGSGWVSLHQDQIEAFAVRYPSHRLALLYCRGRSVRRGHATALLKRIEMDALQEGQISLETEASFFSYPLLLKYGWIKQKSQQIQIAGVDFDRYLMKKKLTNIF